MRGIKITDLVKNEEKVQRLSLIQPSRVKRIMQANKNTGKISTYTPHIVVRALDSFLNDILVRVMNKSGTMVLSKLEAETVAEIIFSDERLSFAHESCVEYTKKSSD